MSFLWYKRPAKEPAKKDGQLSEVKLEDGQSKKSIIPPTISFENVICNKASPPCSLQDFLDYLTYITHDAETLQFYLWMVDYFHRFRRIPKMERALSPRWTGRAPPIKEQNGLRMIATHEIDILSEDISDCDTWGGYEVSEFTDQYTQTLDDIKFSISPVKTQAPPRALHDQFVWHPAEDQPLRSEITRIVNHYLLPGSPRQLNLSHNDRATVLRALEYTTHPSALSPIKKMLDSTLRAHSHPNFIRWTLRNSNAFWLRFLRISSSLTIALATLMAILLTLSHASRFVRLICLPIWWFGMTVLFAACRGVCFMLHTFHARQNHPWEYKSKSADGPTPMNPFDDNNRLTSDINTVMDNQTGAISYESTRPGFPVKMEVFGPTNNFSGERWVIGYAAKPWWRKCWDKRAKVQEEGLWVLQQMMVRQAEVWALALALPLTIIFVALPETKVI